MRRPASGEADTPLFCLEFMTNYSQVHNYSICQTDWSEIRLYMCFCLSGSDGNLYKRVFSESDCVSYSNTKQSCADSRPLHFPPHSHGPITSSCRTTLHQSEEAVFHPLRPSFSDKQEKLPVASVKFAGSEEPRRVTSCHGREEAESDVTVTTKSLTADERAAWPTDRWLIWQLLSSDSVDTLPETIV